MKPRPRLRMVCGLLLAAITLGCAHARTEKYFIAVENTSPPQAALYRSSAEISGLGGVIYHLSQGYVSASLADALGGNQKEPDDLYASRSIPQERAEAINDIEQSRLQQLKGFGATPKYEQPDAVPNLVRYYSDLQAAAHLSLEDQVSISGTASLDPYQFRKLVIIASTQVIKMDEYQKEFDAIEKSVGDIVQSIKNVREAQAASLVAKRKRRSELITSLTESLTLKPDLTSWTGLDFLTAFSRARGSIKE